MKVIEDTRPYSMSRMNRLNSLDAFRGVTIALMLIADNPGNPLRVYPQLRHAAWNGWTIADLAFPFFILIMGMAIPFSIKKRFERGDSGLAICGHIFSRSIFLFLVGLFLNGFPLFDLSIIRIPGVLQRIAVVNLATGLIYFAIKKLTGHSRYKRLSELSIQLGFAFGIIFIYAWIFHFTSVPEQGNLHQMIDLKYLEGHLYLYSPTGDPEGILGTFSAIASGLFGLVAGQILANSYEKKYQAFLMLILGGALLLFLGLTFDQKIPINKNIWSSTYVLLTSGLAWLIIALLYFWMDLYKNITMFKPFIVLGSSPILIYVLSELIRKSLWAIPINSEVLDKVLPMNVWLTTTLFTPWAGEWLDSFYFSVFYVLLWCYIMNTNRKNV